MRHQHVKQPDEFRGGRIHCARHVGSRQQLQAAVMPHHEAFEQGGVHAMQIARGIGHRENRLQVEMERRMSERSQVNQRRLSMRRLQSQGQVYGHGSCAASPFGIEHGKDLAPGTFLAHPPLGRRKPHEGFQQVSCSCGSFDKFPRARSHCANDYLRLTEIADGEYRRLGHLLVQEFNSAQGDGRIVRGDIDHYYVWIGGANTPGDGIGRSHRKRGTGMHSTRYAGAVDQHLQNGALFTIGSDDDDRKLRHTLQLPLERILDEYLVLPRSCSRYLRGGVSNFSLSKNGLGSFGGAGGSVLGEILCTVHSTINSDLLFCAFLLRKKVPRIGISPRPGILLLMSVTRLSISPAITKLCPSCNSNSVSALRVLRAGTVNPEIVSALAKSRVLTSGATFR